VVECLPSKALSSNPSSTKKKKKGQGKDKLCGPSSEHPNISNWGRGGASQNTDPLGKQKGSTGPHLSRLDQALALKEVPVRSVPPALPGSGLQFPFIPIHTLLPEPQVIQLCCGFPEHSPGGVLVGEGPEVLLILVLLRGWQARLAQVTREAACVLLAPLTQRQLRGRAAEGQ
jgi:hypothetical protein